MRRFQVFQAQAIIIVALAAVALVALVALAVDGGSAMLQRRHLQNGADAAVQGDMQLMSSNIAASCVPTPCHPTYLLSNASVINETNQVVAANRGDVIGTAQYTPTLEYHFMSGSPTYSGTYQLATNFADTDLVPSFVDGVRVTAAVNNPTVFARIINIGTLGVSARAAGRLYATCPPTVADGPTLPFTRFRPPVEKRLLDPNVANDLCHPFEFWNPNGDFQQSNFDNLVSFNQTTFHPINGVVTQTITVFDARAWPTTLLGNYNHAANPPWDSCNAGTGANCANMLGSGDYNGSTHWTDVANWIFWQWAGTISIHSTWPRNTETWYPADRTNNGGQTGATTARTGDWAETYQGNGGQNVQQATYDLALLNGIDTPISPPPSQSNPSGLNWGKAINKNIFLWGPPLAGFDPSNPNYDSAQTWQVNGNIPGCTPSSDPRCLYTGWEDLQLSVQTNQQGDKYYAFSKFHAGGSNSSSIDRVRFTRGLTFRFYQNLEGGGGANTPIGPLQPDGSRCNLSLSGSSTYGLFVSQPVPGPVPTGTCGWQPGGGVYYRPIDP